MTNATSQAQANVMVREGELWRIVSRQDNKTARFRALLGFQLLHRLLVEPGVEIHASQLLGDASVSDGLPTIDRQGVESYRRRLLQLQSEIDEARRWNDFVRAEKLEDEHDAILTEVSRVVGRGGRVRVVNADTERARVRATRALRSAIERLGAELPQLGVHLDAAIRTGTYLSYVPKGGVGWRFEEQGAVEEVREQSATHSAPDAYCETVERCPSLPEHVAVPELVSYVRSESADDGLVEALQAMVHSSNARSNSIVVALGSAGSGKSRRIREAARAVVSEVANPKPLILWGNADELVRSPYQPFERALTDLAERSSSLEILGSKREHLVSILPRLYDDIGVVGAPFVDGRPGDVRLLDAVGTCLGELVGLRPTVLVLEDLHHATVDTLTLLSALLRRRLGVCFVLSYNPQLVSSTHPLHRVLSDLVSSDVSSRSFEAPRLTAKDVIELARNLVPGLRADRTAVGEMVAERTAGNALYCIEMLRSLANMDDRALSRVLSHQDERLLSLSDEDRIDPRLRELVLGRLLTTVPNETYALLGHAAVLGVDFEPEALARAHGSTLDAVLRQLGSAVDTGVLTMQRRVPMRFAFSHAIVRQVLYDALSDVERVRLHYRVGSLLMDHLDPFDPDRAAQLAYHFGSGAGSEHHELAIRCACDAGDAAMLRHAYGDAAGWFRQAETLLGQEPMSTAQPVSPAQLTGGVIEDDVDVADLALRRGIAERRSGLAEARATLLRAAQLALELGRERAVAEAAIEANRGFFSQVLEPDSEWIEVIERAIATAEDLHVRAELLAILAAELLWDDTDGRRFALSDEGLRIARSLKDPVTISRVIFRRDHTIATIPSIGDRVDEAREHFFAAASSNDELLILQSMKTCASSLLAAGDIDGSVAFGEEMVRRADNLGLAVWQFVAIIGRAGILVHEGRLDEAMSCGGTMFALGNRAGYGTDAMTFFGELAVHVGRWRGDLAPMTKALLDVAGNMSRHRRIGYFAAPKLFDAGRVDVATECFADAVEQGIGATPHNFMEFMTLSNLAYLSVRLRDSRLANELIERIEPVASAFPCSTSTGPCGAHSVAILRGLLGHVDEADHWFARAVEIHERARAPLHLAETKLEWASALTGRLESGRVVTPDERSLIHAKVASLCNDALNVSRALRSPFLEKWAFAIGDGLEQAVP